MDNNTAETKMHRTSAKDIISMSINAARDKITDLKTPYYRHKKKIISTAVVIIILLTFFLYNSFSGSPSNIPGYQVKKGNFLVTISESGELRAKNSVSIAAPRIRGNLKIIFMVPEGTYVKAGDVVVKFDPTEVLTTFKDAESKLELAISDKDKLIAGHQSQEAQMESDLKTAELTYELSKLNLDQMKFEAEAKQQQAKLQYQKDELTYNRTIKDIESKKIILRSEKNRTEIEIKQRRTELDRAKADLDMLTLTAPTEGLVVYESNWGNSGRKFAVGDNTWPGNTIVTLPDLSSMESVTSVNEVDVSRIKEKLPVELRLDAFQDSVFKGEISSVASLGKTKTYNSPIKVFEIFVSIKDRSSILKPGMTTSNRIIINEIPNVIYIPQESVFEKENRKIVYVKNGSGFDEHIVVVGERNENSIIIKKGLEDGEIVALRDPTLSPEQEETEKLSSEPVGIPNQDRK